MDSSDTNYKAVQQALTLPNKANAACHGQLGDIMPPRAIQCAKRTVQLWMRKARMMWTMQRGHLVVQIKTGYKQSFGKMLSIVFVAP